MSKQANAALLRGLPQVEELLRKPTIQALVGELPQAIVVDGVRDSIAALRAEILAGGEPTVDTDAIIEDARRRLLGLRQPSLRPVINLTGIIIHTNLGRSILADDVIETVVRVAKGYSTLEYDTESQSRGSRHRHYEALICALTGAEAAIAVNNNAAAAVMVLSEFAAGQEAIVSRGELVEIGGSFRVPDIMRLSRAKMVEVGTTNKTHLRDYQAALSRDTRMLLKVHPSNYRMVGFTESVSVKELCQLADKENAQRRADGQSSGWANSCLDNQADVCGCISAYGRAGGRTNSYLDNQADVRGCSSVGAGADDRTSSQAESPSNGQQQNLLVYQDLGSGALLPLEFGEDDEPTVRGSLAQGCDLVSFSADKLLGGPQAGIIVGKKALISQLKQSPLARVLRLDKLTLAALEGTLRHYLDASAAIREIPTLRMLSEPLDSVRQRAERLEQALRAALAAALAAGQVELSVIPESTRAGGGALPMCDIDTFVVRIDFPGGDAQSCERYLISQREIPIITRIKKQSLLCDVRTIADESEIAETATALRDYFATLTGKGDDERQGRASGRPSTSQKSRGGGKR